MLFEVRQPNPLEHGFPMDVAIDCEVEVGNCGCGDSAMHLYSYFTVFFHQLFKSRSYSGSYSANLELKNSLD